jgi:repressor LexA
MLPPLTARQKRIYDFIAGAIRDNGYAPSIPEIGKRFKIASTRGVFDHLKALENKGYIKRIGKRAIEIVSPTGRSAFPEATEIPILGRSGPGPRFWPKKTLKDFCRWPMKLLEGKKALRSGSKATA